MAWRNEGMMLELAGGHGTRERNRELRRKNETGKSHVQTRRRATCKERPRFVATTTELDQIKGAFRQIQMVYVAVNAGEIQTTCTPTSHERTRPESRCRLLPESRVHAQSGKQGGRQGVQACSVLRTLCRQRDAGEHLGVARDSGLWKAAPPPSSRHERAIPVVPHGLWVGLSDAE